MVRDSRSGGVERVVTIGVYGFTAESFFAALQQAGVDTFCDLRRRRGVRGAAYSFANSKRLQERLQELGIRYVHQLALAPPDALRRRQHEADARAGEAKRQRQALAPAFVAAYEEEVLAGFTPQQWLESLGQGTRVVALFCVEREPQACHRSLVAARLHETLGLPVQHLLPQTG